jgi:hypothetical protein
MPPSTPSRLHASVADMPCRNGARIRSTFADENYEQKRHVINPAQYGDTEHTFGASFCALSDVNAYGFHRGSSFSSYRQPTRGTSELLLVGMN